MPKPTTRARKNLDDSGERVATMFLEQRGYRIIARNYRTRVGEMDLIAEDADGVLTKNLVRVCSDGFQ